MACNSCGKKKKACDNKEFTKAVVEINNPETNVLIRKVVIPTSLGDDVTNPPAIGRYCNVVLYYEANQHIYLYSSDGIPTLISDNGDVDFNYIQNRPWYNGAPMTSETRIPKVPTAVSELNNDRNYQTASQVSSTVSNAVATETTARQNADNTLQTNINNEKTARQNADTTLQNNITAEATTRGNADTALQNNINAEALARQNAITALTNEINRDVMYDLEMSTSAQSVSFQEDKINVVTGQTKTEIDTIPAASKTTAGIITAAEYTTLVDAEEKINALLDGAVAITGISANPSQQDLTTAWENATGRDELINRASIFDVDNQLVWTYYTNASLWESVPAGGQVTINQFENGVAGTITGSTLDGNVSANLDGTGSVSGWTTVKNDIATNTAAIATKANITDIPTVNNATLTIQKNGSNVATFTANSATNATANISVPTKTSDLTNDSNFVNTTQLATKQDVLTAGNAIDITSNVISANVHPADFFTNDATDSDKGNPLYFEGTTEEKLANIMLEGDTDQTTYSGIQLLTGNGYATSSSDTTYWNLTANTSNENLGNAWGRWTSTQNTQWVNMYSYMATGISGGAYKPDTKYTLLVEWANAQNVSQMSISQETAAVNAFIGGNKAITGIDSSPNGSQKFVLTTKSTITQGMYALRSFITKTTAADAAKIDLRVTIVEGDYSSTSIDWQPYVGGTASPNPDYPQDIKIVTGEQTVKITGKSLLNNAAYAGTSNGITTTKNSDGSYTIFGTATDSWATTTQSFSRILAAGNYTISVSKALPFTVMLRIYDTATNTRHDYALNAGNTTRTFYADYEIKNAMWFISSMTTGTTYDTTFSIQLEKGSTATDIEPYQEQSYTISLGSTELCKIGDYKDYFYKDGGDWYIHKEIGKVIFDGTESWSYGGNNLTIARTSIGAKGATADLYSNVATANKNYGVNNNECYIGNNNVIFSKMKVNGAAVTSASTWTTYLANNDVTFYFPLATATNTKITDAGLVAQLNILWYGAHSYDNVTWISAQSSGVDLPFIIDATVVENSLAGVNYAIDNKQDILTAGNNITITNNVISASVPTVNNATLTIQKNGTNVATFTANSSTNATANITVPTITMTNVDPGEGSPLAANNFIAVYEA